MEGSLLILPGSGLIALGTYLGGADPKASKEWLVLFILNAIGVGALWGLSEAGGFGGTSGRSMWWGVLILPYVFGWLLGIVRLFATAVGLFKARSRKQPASQSETANS
jgi:hypothetical protein